MVLFKDVGLCVYEGVYGEGVSVGVRGSFFFCDANLCVIKANSYPQVYDLLRG